MFLRAKTSDQAELLTWVKRYYDHDHIAFDSQIIGPSLNPLLLNDDYGVAYFVQIDQTTVGYFIVTWAYDIEYGGRHATVTDLYFDERTRRFGVGSQSLKFIENFCRDLKLTVVFLQVEIENIHAQAFYQKSGFALHTRYTMMKAITS
jgi:ribosomal protein S18 acetylase RimI-like enzyme